MCALALAFSRSKIVLLITTVFLWFKKRSNSSISLNTFGSLFAIASMIIPKVTCICVDLKRLLSTISDIASRLSSMMTLIPSLSDSSRNSEIPSICLSRTSCAIFSMSLDLFTWKGSSSMTMTSLFPFCSMCVFARTLIRPRPVVYASVIPLRPKMIPPVGKSGP